MILEPLFKFWFGLGLGRELDILPVAGHGRVRLTARLTEADAGQHEGHGVLSSHHRARPKAGK